MLKPAILYKDILEKKFAEYLYTDDFFWYTGYGGCNELPKLEPRDDDYKYAIVDGKDNVIGYFAYRIEFTVDTVLNFGLYSFDKGNPLIGKDLFEKMEELVREHRRIEWRMISGNPVQKHYDKFCKEHNGYIHHFHDTGRDLNGNLVDSYSYEIINDKR